MHYAWDTYGIAHIKMKLAERSGEPDQLFLVHGGRPLWLEFKREGETLRPLQAHRHGQLKGWGYDVETSDNKADTKRIIDQAATRAGIKPLTKKLEAQKIPTSRRALLSIQRLRRNMG